MHRCSVVVILLAAHAALLDAISTRVFHRSAEERADAADEPMMVGEIIAGRPEWDEVPLPEVSLRTVPIDLNTLQLIQFTDSESLDDIVASASAPRPMRVQNVDLNEFARRAHVIPGRPMTVLLAVEVLADGTTGSAVIVRGCGDHEADAAAVNYARSLHWMPATAEHQAKKERILFPVTLAVS